jgi:selenide,water dikinase
VKRLLLVGGGHSHVEVIRRFGLHPPAGVRVTVVSPDRHTPYSGMLPGLVAGHYAFGDCHIDLEALCRKGAIDFVQGTVAALDLPRNEAVCADGRRLAFDVVAVNTGSVPAANTPGARQHAIGIKPVAGFLTAWNAVLEQARAGAEPLRLAVAGGGAGGVEILLAMEHRLRATLTDRHPSPELALITDSDTLLPSHPRRVQRIFTRIFRERGIALHAGSGVTQVEPGLLRLSHGSSVAADWAVWVTGAAAPAWPRASGLAVDARGFILVDSSLRSVSHGNVFAAGDIASMAGHPHPKSGVYAVRQGPPLALNLRAALVGGPPARYHPQPRALALISAGDRYAVASYAGLALEGRWVWRWKDRIDRAFMARYR